MNFKLNSNNKVLSEYTNNMTNLSTIDNIHRNNHAIRQKYLSQFCVLIATEISENTPIVEFGCGNSHDSIFLSNYGYHIYASDISKESIAMNKENILSHNALEDDDILQPSFSVCDCTNVTEVENLVRKARVGKGNIAVYSRFLLHSIDESQEKLFFHALKTSLIFGDRIYMEFRCSMDESLPKFSNKDSIKRYVYTPDLLEFLDEVGFFVEYEQTGQGVAKFRNEDPFVSRIIARRR